MATGDLPRPTRRQRRRIESAVARAEATTGLQVCVVLGTQAEGDPRVVAESGFVAAGLLDRPAVLLLVDPPHHHVEVVTGPLACDRISDEAAQAAVASMVQRFRKGDLVGGLEAGLDELVAAAGPGTAEPGATDLPNLF